MSLQLNIRTFLLVKEAAIVQKPGKTSRRHRFIQTLMTMLGAFLLGFVVSCDNELTTGPEAISEASNPQAPGTTIDVDDGQLELLGAKRDSDSDDSEDDSESDDSDSDD